MPDILIRGVQFPTMKQAYKTLIVSYDGKVYEGVHPQPTAKKEEPIAEAIELPPHGDLIDRDVLQGEFDKAQKSVEAHGREFSDAFMSGGEVCAEWWAVERKLEDAPTIIPADMNRMMQNCCCFSGEEATE